MKRDGIRRSPGGARSCAQLAAWLVVIGLTIAALSVVVLGALAWQEQAGELAQLRARVDELAAGARLTEVHATAAALDGRVAALERDAAAAEPSPAPTGVPASDVPAAGAPGLLEELAANQAALTARIEALEQRAAGAVEWDQPSTAATRAVPDMVRLDVAAQKQQHSLSCESAAASMAARYQGMDLSEADILASLPLDANPHLGFRGNVDGPPGGTVDYGVYAEPVVEVLADHGLNARMVAGGLAGIQAALARGNPVVAWVTYDCMASTPVNETVAGQPVVLVPYQHAVVVTGYDSGGVWANDPWDGGQDYYRRADFERALGYFGEMAIEVATMGEEGSSR